MNEKSAEKAVHYLRDSAIPCAQAKAQRLYLEHWLKVVLAQEMAKHDGSIASAEVKARCSEAYLQALEGYRQAVEADEKGRFLREAAQAAFEGWRTTSSNERALGKVT
jgi:hypothetical protein